MNKKILIHCCIFFSNLAAMDEPFDWAKRVIARLSSPHKAPEASPRKPDVTIQDCHALANLALEIDQLYRNGREIIDKERVETAYIKALKCFITIVEENKQDAKLHLTKLHALFLELELEKKQTNPAYVMSTQISEFNKKVYDLIKSDVNERNQ